MLAKDSTGRSVQVLHPLDGGCQTLAATNGARTRTLTAFKSFTVAVAVRMRSPATACVRLGGATVDAVLGDMTLTIDDGWVFLSLDGMDAAGAPKNPRPDRLSILAVGGDVSVDVQEYN